VQSTREWEHQREEADAARAYGDQATHIDMRNTDRVELSVCPSLQFPNFEGNFDMTGDTEDEEPLWTGAHEEELICQHLEEAALYDVEESESEEVDDWGEMSGGPC